MYYYHRIYYKNEIIATQLLSYFDFDLCILLWSILPFYVLLTKSRLLFPELQLEVSFYLFVVFFYLELIKNTSWEIIMLASGKVKMQSHIFNKLQLFS